MDEKRILNLLAMLLGAWPFLFAQRSLSDSFPLEKATGIMNVLAGDSLRGRGNMTEDLLKAGKFIGREFAEAGLKPLPGAAGFFHEFQPYGKDKKNSLQLQWNGKKIKPKDFTCLTPEPGMFPPRDLSSFRVIHVDSFSANMLEAYNDSLVDLLIWTESKGGSLTAITIPAGGIPAARLLVKAGEAPRSLSLTARAGYYRSAEYNIAGMVPGRSKPGECIIITSHYDHEGIRKGRDSIMNGANDNASGTTAMIMLAHYFSMRNDNERTLIFCAFAGEELGLKGSSKMAKQLTPSKLKAVINLEMLGFPQYGKKTVYITGEKYSSLPAILKKGLTQNGVNVVGEPSEDRMLFARSDNYPFVLRGVAAHTIMASDDSEPCYHKPCDETERMDIPNLCFIARAIASACEGLISGKDTPGDIMIPE